MAIALLYGLHAMQGSQWVGSTIYQRLLGQFIIDPTRRGASFERFEKFHARLLASATAAGRA